MCCIPVWGHDDGVDGKLMRGKRVGNLEIIISSGERQQ